MLADPWTGLDSAAGLNGRTVLTSCLLVWDCCQVSRSPSFWGNSSLVAAAATCVGGWLRDVNSSWCFLLRKDSDQGSWGCLPGRWSRISRASNLCLAWLGMNQCSAALLAMPHGKGMTCISETSILGLEQIQWNLGLLAD